MYITQIMCDNTDKTPGLFHTQVQMYETHESETKRKKQIFCNRVGFGKSFFPKPNLEIAGFFNVSVTYTETNVQMR